MSHENSPACSLVATHCCVCHRALTDALSVELGIGPICREKHGFDANDKEPNFFGVAVAIETIRSIVPEETFSKLDAALTSENARTACNILVHWLAAKPEGDHVKPCVNAIRDLGFATLATTLEENLLVYVRERKEAKKASKRPVRVAKIFVWTTGDTINLDTENLSDSQFQAFLSVMRKCHSRRWNSANKVNTVKTWEKRNLWTLLNTNFDLAGVSLDSEKGITVLGQTSDEPAHAA